jgi:hypothetical protein
MRKKKNQTTGQSKREKRLIDINSFDQEALAALKDHPDKVGSKTRTVD